MKRIKTVAVLILVLTVLFTACGRSDSFETAPIVTTTEKVTEAVSYEYSEYAVFGTRMGMSILETQNAIGLAADVATNNSGYPYFIVNKLNLPFVTPGLEGSMYFLFDKNYRLCGIQYQSTESTGFVLSDAIANYDAQYGRHVVVDSDNGKKNYVWYKGDIYGVITTAPNGQNAMSFFGEKYFTSNYKEEAAAYNKK